MYQKHMFLTKSPFSAYWVRPGIERRLLTQKSLASLATQSTHSSTGHSQDSAPFHSLIKWNARVLESLLLKVMKHNRARPRETFSSKKHMDSTTNGQNVVPLDEALESISFSPYQSGTMKNLTQGDSIKSIGKQAKKELLSFVSHIAGMYQNVHFHNFEHASHVTMSANKLMSKISEMNGSSSSSSSKKMSNTEDRDVGIFFNTFGICSDPLSHFAVVFAALIHDADHYGLPNAELIQEQPALGAKFKNTSVAEQNSIGKAWALLMGPGFENLRECISGGDSNSMHRFKQLLIRMIIATDITDKERMGKEKKRWDEAFTDIAAWDKQWRSRSMKELQKIDVSLKATAVLEALMLGSDIAHTMQHWITFAKWNKKLFKERMMAYIEGRSEVDPRLNWYESELGFFDFYIIPLATRLKQCGVFGTAGDEYLGYALKNRQEWTEKGHLLVMQYEKWAETQVAELDDDNSMKSFAA